jgi:DNA-binding transcriptional LysR family regulator
VFPKIEVRHLHAVVVLAEELNFTRAAHRLHITQPTLSLQITEIEKENRLHLFVRGKGQGVQLTDAGRIFVEEANQALIHTERAIHMARAADEGRDRTLVIGHSPHVEQHWISSVLAIRLPLYPTLRVRLSTRFEMDLIRSVLTGELNLALATAPPEDAQITAVPFARAPLYAAVPENHPVANKKQLMLKDLAMDEWILLSKQVNPIIHHAIVETARSQSIAFKDAHDILTAEQAFHLVSEHVGIAILTKATAQYVPNGGVVVKPLSDDSLCFQTCLVMRADDSSRMVNEFARSFLRVYIRRPLQPRQMDLPLPAFVSQPRSDDALSNKASL